MPHNVLPAEIGCLKGERELAKKNKKGERVSAPNVNSSIFVTAVSADSLGARFLFQMVFPLCVVQEENMPYLHHT